MTTKQAERKYLDEYLVEVMRQEYLVSSPSDRVQMLERIGREQRDYPSEIRKLAISDHYTWVRMWAAKNMYLFDEEKQILASDMEPVVRAALYENRHDLGLDLINTEKFVAKFLSLSAIERKAFMRGKVDSTQLEMLIDPDCKGYRFDLTLKERAELLLAYLDNDYFRHVLKQEESGKIYGPSDYMADNMIHIMHVWKIIKGWPTGQDQSNTVVFAIAQFIKSVHLSQKEKIEFFNTTENAWLKSAVIESCQPYEQELIELGTKSEEKWVRSAAYARVRRLSPEQIEHIKQTKDQDALFGLARNEQLPLEVLEELSKLSSDWTWADFHKTINDRQFNTWGESLGDDLVLEDETLFSTRHLKDEKDVRFVLLEHKINKLGKKAEFVVGTIEDVKTVAKMLFFWGLAGYVAVAVWKWFAS